MYAAHHHANMPNYKLTYFDGRGRAETIRLILAIAGAKYEDIRLTFASWGELKSNTPWGQLPILEFNGKMLGQSSSICRFLAKEAGLAGKNAWEQAQVDSIADAVLDVREKMFGAASEKDEEKKTALLKNYLETSLPPMLANLEKQLVANGGGDGWFVGKEMTWVDLHLLACTEHAIEKFPDILKDTPKLTGLISRVKQSPKVAKWLETRPVTEF